MNYIFDIDGTLTPSRGKINKDFQDKFYKWMVSTKKSGDNVYFITGSDKDKTIEQIGKRIWKTATQCYQSCGNAVYENGKLIHQIDFAFTNELRELLNNFLEGSPMYGKYTTNIEERIGLINFSTIGRDCPQDARDKYCIEEDERLGFCKKIIEPLSSYRPSRSGFPGWNLGGSCTINQFHQDSLGSSASYAPVLVLIAWTKQWLQIHL